MAQGQIRIKLAALATMYGLDPTTTIATFEPNTLVLTPRPKLYLVPSDEDDR